MKTIDCETHNGPVAILDPVDHPDSGLRAMDDLSAAQQDRMPGGGDRPKPHATNRREVTQ